MWNVSRFYVNMKFCDHSRWNNLCDAICASQLFVWLLFQGLIISCYHIYYFSLVILPNTKYIIFFKSCFLCSKLNHINEILFEKGNCLSKELLLQFKNSIHLLCKNVILFIQSHFYFFLYIYWLQKYQPPQWGHRSHHLCKLNLIIWANFYNFFS